MKKELQRIKIAEALGYTHVRIIKAIEGPPDIGIGHHPTEPHSIPDYLNDHSAMYLAKKTLSEDDLGSMLDHLCKIVRRDHDASYGPMTAMIQAFRATAEQEAEAFLKTLNLWEE